MYGKFKYDTIPLEKIFLDVQNPRIVQLDAPKTHQEALAYLFEHEELLPFIKTVALEGKNKGAERPYVIPKDGNFIVIEGNTRIAAYRVLCGLDPVPSEYQSEIPAISEEQKTTLQTVDCTVAPDRDRLLQIMARSHFGRGDKARWGYLGSRKAVHDEYLKGASLVHLAKSFDRTKGQIISLILEYKLYLEALTLGWTTQEKQLLLDPRLEFNPPVRFLETQGHKKVAGRGL